MKKWILMVLFAVSIAPGGLIHAVNSHAGVNLNITIPLPGPEVGPPPPLVVVPGTEVYYAPYGGTDVFFYSGNWYRPYRGGWYVSAEFNGPWGRVALGNVPPPLVSLPPDYRDAPYGHGMGHHGRGMGMGGMGMGR